MVHACWCIAVSVRLQSIPVLVAIAACFTGMLICAYLYQKHAQPRNILSTCIDRNRIFVRKCMNPPDGAEYVRAGMACEVVSVLGYGLKQVDGKKMVCSIRWGSVVSRPGNCKVQQDRTPA